MNYPRMLAPDGKPYLTVPEVSAQLGVTKSYVHALIKSKPDAFPSVATLGEPSGARTIYGIAQSDVDAMLEERKSNVETTKTLLSD